MLPGPPPVSLFCFCLCSVAVSFTALFFLSSFSFMVRSDNGHFLSTFARRLVSTLFFLLPPPPPLSLLFFFFILYKKKKIYMYIRRRTHWCARSDSLGVGVGDGDILTVINFIEQPSSKVALTVRFCSFSFSGFVAIHAHYSHRAEAFTVEENVFFLFTQRPPTHNIQFILFM